MYSIFFISNTWFHQKWFNLLNYFIVSLFTPFLSIQLIYCTYKLGNSKSPCNNCVIFSWASLPTFFKSTFLWIDYENCTLSLWSSWYHISDKIYMTRAINYREIFIWSREWILSSINSDSSFSFFSILIHYPSILECCFTNLITFFFIFSNLSLIYVSKLS